MDDLPAANPGNLAMPAVGAEASARPDAALVGSSGASSGWEMSPSGQAAAIGAVAFGTVLVWYAVRGRRGRAARAGVPAPDVAAVASDLEELTERLAAELDAKAARVEALIARADEAARRLEAATEGAVRVHEARARRADSGAPRERSGHPGSEPTGLGSLGSDPAHRAVYELADAGLSPADIARRLDRPTGQVELILNLRRGTVAL